MLYHMACIKVDNFIKMHDKPQNFLTAVDKTSVHRLVHYGVVIYIYVYAVLSLLRVSVDSSFIVSSRGV